VAVKLRLMRLGRKGQPFYRIVAVDSRKRRDGAYLDKIGHYNPKTRPAEIVLDAEKALKWLGHGAIPSDTVRSLFSRCGVMMAFDLQRRGLPAEEVNARVAQYKIEKEAALRERDKAPVQAPPPEKQVEKPAEVEKPATVAEVEPAKVEEPVQAAETKATEEPAPLAEAKPVEESAPADESAEPKAENPEV
jgi:small subunit ribosomal protein S16